MPVAGAVGLAISGFIAAIIITVAVVGVIDSLGVGIRDNLVFLIGISVITQGIGFGVAAFAYLRYFGKGIEFLRIKMPTLRDFVWMIGGVIGLFASLLTMSYLVTVVGFSQPAEHQIAALGQQNPVLLLVLIPLSFLVIGPGEELLFRGVIQTWLIDEFRSVSGIIVTSVIFALGHLAAYSGGNIVLSLSILFVLSLLLGGIYELTDNLVVPAIVHGAYNAILFLGLYASIVFEDELDIQAGFVLPDLITYI
jgi:membrane protease YdiL (CAAX protease family)